MNLSDFALPLFVPAILFLISSILMIKSEHHSTNVKRLHFIGRFYISLCYFLALINLFNIPFSEYQVLFRGATALLAVEEITVWIIEKLWPTRKVR